MTGHFDLGPYLGDAAVRADQKSCPDHAHEAVAVHRFLAPDAIGLQHVVGRVGSERDGEAVFPLELVECPDRVGGDPEDDTQHDDHSLTHIEKPLLKGTTQSVATKSDVADYNARFAEMNRRMRNLARSGVPKNEVQAKLYLDDLGWNNTVSTTTWATGLTAYYDEMAAQ